MRVPFLIGDANGIEYTWREHLVPGGTQPLKGSGYPDHQSRFIRVKNCEISKGYSNNNSCNLDILFSWPLVKKTDERP